jgi:hypothetical protein
MGDAMKKTKKHLLLSLKKKSGVITEAEQKELDTLEAEAAKACAEDDKKKEEEAKKAADEAAAKAKADEEAKKKADEEAKAKEEEAKKKEGEAGSVTMESLAAQIAEMSKNMNMIMEALSVVLESGAPVSEEAKEGEAVEGSEEEVEDEMDEEKGDMEVDSEEEEMTEEEMEKELEKTIAELEALESEV